MLQIIKILFSNFHSRRPIVFFDVTINDVPAGTVFFELFNETVPRTSENFRILTTGKRKNVWFIGQKANL